MRLILSSSRPLNTVLVNEEGQPLYVSKTPFKWSHQRTIIYRVQPDFADWKYDIEEGKFEGGDEEVDFGLAELAQVDWHTIGPSILRYRGIEISFKDYLHTEDILGLNHTFTASDGNSYRWKSGPATFSTLALERDDDSHTKVAHFHRPSLGIIGTRHKAYLEIFPEGMTIIDDIVVTFLYLEKLHQTSSSEFWQSFV